MFEYPIVYMVFVIRNWLGGVHMAFSKHFFIEIVEVGHVMSAIQHHVTIMVLNE